MHYSYIYALIATTYMIIYNVTIKVETSVADEWANWMKKEHMPDVMGTKLFVESRLCRLLEQDEAEGVTYVAQYYCATMNEYNAYIDEYATDMRERAFKAYGNKFVAFRTIMEVI